jgi:glutamine synthetase
MNNENTNDWMTTLPKAFLTHKGSRRLDEVESIIPDIVGMSRGKTMPAHKFSPTGITYLPVSLFYQTISGEYVDMDDIENQWTERDIVLRPDMSTATAVPWSEDASVQIINNIETLDGEALQIAPRNVLRRIMALYSDKGWQPVVAPELEFYLTKPNTDPTDDIQPPVGRTGRIGARQQAFSMVAVDEFGDVIDTIYDYTEAQGLEIDTIIQEGGAGQIEINLMHGDPLTLADQVFYFKRTIREAALKHGVFATFMAKPMRDQPGSAMHIHQSIVDEKTGKNIFSNADGSPTDLFYHFIGGSQKHLQNAVPLLAPYVNSYRRLAGAYSAPSNLEWAADNRTTGLRIPNSGPEARRVENRVSGSDANPYLAISASLAAGYLGMVNSIKPRDPVDTEIFETDTGLPHSLFNALTLFEQDQELREILGPEFCDLYRQIKHTELLEYQREISPWEREHLLLNA